MNLISTTEVIMEFFEGGPILNILFFVLAFLGIILAIIFYVKSLRIKKPSFSQRTTSLINDPITTLRNIEIRYKQTIIKNLSITKFAIWNSGKEAIRKSDIAPTDPIEIKINEGKVIYDVEIFLSNPINSFLVSQKDDRTIEITFEFLDFNEGAVLNIYHNGGKNDLKINGTIIGGGEFKYGIETVILMNKLDQLMSPIEWLTESKFWVVKRLGILLFVITFPILIILFFVIFLVGLFQDKIIRKIPPEFNLNK